MLQEKKGANISFNDNKCIRKLIVNYYCTHAVFLLFILSDDYKIILRRMLYWRSNFH